MQLTKQDWYLSLIEDVDALRVEGVFNHHWILIETYHQIGRRISLEKEELEERGMTLNELLQSLARDIGKGQRMLRYAVKFYELFPDLGDLPEGKNVTMNKIIQIYLTEGKEKKTKLYRCPQCDHEGELNAFKQ